MEDSESHFVMFCETGSLRLEYLRKVSDFKSSDHSSREEEEDFVD